MLFSWAIPNNTINTALVWKCGNAVVHFLLNYDSRLGNLSRKVGSFDAGTSFLKSLVVQISK